MARSKQAENAKRISVGNVKKPILMSIRDLILSGQNVSTVIVTLKDETGRLIGSLELFDPIDTELIEGQCDDQAAA